MTSSKDYILIGKIKGAHGTKGALLVQSFTAKTPDIQNYKPLFLEGALDVSTSLKVIRLKEKGLLVASIPTVTDRTQAEAMKGKSLYTLRESFPVLVEDTFYYADLKGAQVYTQDDQHLGHVTHLANFGAGDILEVELKDPVHHKKIFIPFSKEMVLSVERTNRKVVVDAELFALFNSNDKDTPDEPGH